MAQESRARALIDVLFGEPGMARCLVAPNGRVVRANDEWLRSTGYELDDVVGAEIADLLPATRVVSAAMYARARQGHVVEVPPHAPPAPGRLARWAGSLVPVGLEDGIGVLITTREVSREAMGPAANARQEELITRLFERLPVMITTYDPELGAFRFNDEFRRVLGWTEEDAAAADLMVLAYPDPAIRAQAAAHMLSPAQTWQEFPVTAKDGSIVPSAWANIRLSDDTQVGIGLDLRERKRAEQALRASEERFRTLFTNMTEGFALGEAIRDQSGDPCDFRFLEMNDAFEHQSGLSREAALGRSIREVLPQIEQSWIDMYCAVAFGAPARHFENYNTDLDKHFSVYCFSPTSGRFAIVFTDITERKRAEQALRLADRRKNEFLAMLSHELRNPLAPIRTGIYLLEHTPPDSPQAARAREVIRRQTDHMTRLVDDLLDLTRISRGKIELKRQVLDLREVVRKAADDLRSMFEQSGLELRVEYTAGPVWIDADPTRISQVLGNILQNSLKFTPGGGAVWVRITAATGRAEVQVRDNGVGIDPAELERMFEPFAQAESGLARTKGGLGLGLSLVRGLAELHGGSVRAHSAGIGHGAEFTVTFPIASVTTVAAPAERPLSASARLVLIVEDNVDAGHTLADMLVINGHCARVAHDAAAGLALAREIRPDVVVCDIGLPGTNGYEVARAIRADPQLAGARLIALSGYAQSEDLQRAREAGFDAFVPKPADPVALLNALGGEP